MSDITSTPKTLIQLVADKAPEYYIRERVEATPLRALYEEIRDHVDPMKNPASPYGGLDYFSQCYEWTQTIPKSPVVFTDETKLGDVRYRWIAVFPTTGGNEGHYVHVDLIARDQNPKAIYGTETRIPLFLGKTFGGRDEAIALAGELARLLGV